MVEGSRLSPGLPLRVGWSGGAGVPDAATVEGTPLLTEPAWSPSQPVPLETVDLAWTSTLTPAVSKPVDGEGLATCPEREDGSLYPSYSAVIAELDAPLVFENRTTYQLRAADLAGDRPSLVFGPGTYFDGIDTGEACAHEFAAFRMGLTASTPLRDAIGDPCDPARRPTNLAISALTLRHDRAAGEVSFPLHWRIGEGGACGRPVHGRAGRCVPGRRRRAGASAE